MLIPAVFLKSFLRISQGSPNAISSPESGGGHSPCDSQESPPLNLSGPQASRASHSVRRENSAEPRTSDTSPPCSLNSSGSAALQSALESRLLQNLHGLTGSPEYVWSLKHWDIPSGPPIFALRARARSEKDGLCVAIRSLGRESSSDHPTSDNGFTGWRSPATTEPGVSLERLQDANGDPWMPGQRAYDKITGRLAQVGLTHEAQAALTGWPTPIASSNCESHEAAMKELDRAENCSDGGCSKLAVMAHIPIVGYPTPCAGDEKWRCSQNKQAVARLESGKQMCLETVAHLNYSPAETAKPAALNPAFSRWLMGFPVEWCQAAIRTHRSMPTQRRKPAQCD